MALLALRTPRPQEVHSHGVKSVVIKSMLAQAKGEKHQSRASAYISSTFSSGFPESFFGQEAKGTAQYSSTCSSTANTCPSLHGFIKNIFPDHKEIKIILLHNWET